MNDNPWPTKVEFDAAMAAVTQVIDTFGRAYADGLPDLPTDEGHYYCGFDQLADEPIFAEVEDGEIWLLTPGHPRHILGTPERFAPWVRLIPESEVLSVKAEAWDEGHAAPADSGHWENDVPRKGVRAWKADPTPNPYRLEEL